MPFHPSFQPASLAAPAAGRRWSARSLVARAALAATLLFLGIAGPSEATLPRCPVTIHIHSGQCWYTCYLVGQEPDGTCDYDYCTQEGCN